MYSGKRKLIGVFVNNIENDSFQQEACLEISRLTEERGFDAAVFNSFANTASGDLFEKLEIRLIDLAPIEKMDAIILLTDTFLVASQREYMLEQVAKRRRSDCPVINLRGGSGDCDRFFGAGNYYSIKINQEKAYESLIEHVISKHKVKNPCFMSGTKGHEDAVLRLGCFERVCSRNNIKLHDHSIFHGDFWHGMTDQALEFFYADPDNEPDAIICANDYMAMAILMKLLKMGKKIPDDVIVTGFDDLPETSRCFPSLTTMGVSFTDMVRTAVGIAEDCWNGIGRMKKVSLEPIMKRRASCGCNVMTQNELLLDHNKMIEESNVTYIQQTTMTYTFMRMSNCRNLKEFVDTARLTIETYDDYDSFYLCLCSDDGSDDIPSTDFSDTFKEKIIVALSIKDGEATDYYNIPESERAFRKDEVLPRMASEDRPTCYYCVMLHNDESCLGYTAISFKNHKMYDYNYQCWTISYSVGLTEMISRIRLERERALNERMSVTDALTQLLNRRGFEDQSKKMIYSIDSTKEEVCIISIDLDGLKQINDHYGHAEGDFAIQSVGKAILCLTGGNGIAARMGGDEFMVMRPVPRGEEPLDYEGMLSEKLKKVNEESGKPYTVAASVGTEHDTIEGYKKLEEIIRRSDEKLYAAKRQLRRRASDSDRRS